MRGHAERLLSTATAEYLKWNNGRVADGGLLPSVAGQDDYCSGGV